MAGPSMNYMNGHLLYNTNGNANFTRQNQQFVGGPGSQNHGDCCGGYYSKKVPCDEPAPLMLNTFRRNHADSNNS